MIMNVLKYFTLILLISLCQNYAPSFNKAHARAPNFLLEEESTIKDLKPTDVIFWKAISGLYYQDEYISVPVLLETKMDFSLYTSKVTFSPPPGTEIVKIKTPAIDTLKDPVSRKMVDVYKGGYFEVVLKAKTPITENKIYLSVNYLGCTSKVCLFPYTENIEVQLFPTPSTFLNNEVPPKESDTIKPIEAVQESDDQLDLQDELAKKITEGSLPFYLVIILCLVGGILTNLTPCVYPMIPITIRVLSHQSKRPYVGSSMYALGILITYTALGIFAVLTGSLFGSIMASKSFNLVLGLIMVIMAFSMLGFGNFSKLQQLGSKLGAGKASLKNAFIMGTGAGLVASPCTGPVLATLLTYTAGKGDLGEAVILLSTYSFGFALPYIVLGSAAAKVSQVKLSPKLQIVTKLLFASVILALGLFYLRIPFNDLIKRADFNWQTLYSSFLTLGILMVGILAISKRMYSQKSFLIGPTIAIGIGIFAFSQSSSLTVKKVKWMTNEEKAFEISKNENRPILIDAWAEWCVACKKMEVTTFADPKVLSVLSAKNYITLKLDLTESDDKSEALQQKYKIQGLPTLIVIPSGGDLSKMNVLNGLQTPGALLPVLNKID